ncbi:hypothetical protein Q9Q99_01095 [Curtobacterium flaccumfaciens]|nr:hypothetical protein Q9Q99_01095 [Curtobacterium flaccumfaciens]
MEHHPVPTTVLWDIDGTLVMNASSPGNLYHLALERAVGRDLTLRVGHQHGRTDAGLIAEHVRAHAFRGHPDPHGQSAPARPDRRTARLRRPPQPRPRSEGAPDPVLTSSGGATACSPATPSTAPG